MTKPQQNLADLVTLIIVGLAAAGGSAWVLGLGGTATKPAPIPVTVRGLIQLGGGFALALFAPDNKAWRLVKLGGVGMALAGAYSSAQNFKLKMLAGKMGQNGALTPGQLQYLRNLSGPMQMRRMAGPMEMRNMRGAGGNPAFMGRQPDMMGRGMHGGFRASC